MKFLKKSLDFFPEDSKERKEIENFFEDLNKKRHVSLTKTVRAFLSLSMPELTPETKFPEKEKRTSHRYEISLNFFLHSEEKKENITTESKETLKDISEGGLSFTSENKLEIGSILKLTLPVSIEETLKLKAKICYRKKIKTEVIHDEMIDYFHYGIQFSPLNPEQLKRLRKGILWGLANASSNRP